MKTTKELLADQIRAGGRTTTTLNGLRIRREDGKTLVLLGQPSGSQIKAFLALIDGAGYRKVHTVSTKDGMAARIEAKR